MQNSYWQKVLQTRINRRRALAATSMTMGAAAFLAACGGDDDSSSSGSTSSGGSATTAAGGATAAATDKSGLLYSPADTLSAAVKGGTLIDYCTAEPSHLDAMQPLNSLNFQARNMYSTLLVEDAGYRVRQRA